MVLVVKCLICKKELTYAKGDPSPLVTHVKFEHPELNKSKKSNVENKKLDREVETSFGINKSSQTDENYFTMGGKKTYEKSMKEEVLNETKFFDAPNKSTSYHPEDVPKDKKSNFSAKFDKTVYEDALSDDESADDFTKLLPKAASSPIQKNETAKISHKNVTEKTPLKNTQSRVFADTKKGQAYYSKDDDVHRSLESTKRSENLQKIYFKTSIEKWTPVGDRKIHCPRCQAYKRPIVKAKKEQTTESSILSAFMAACFPLYCSPCCVLPKPKFEYLHCPICDFHLGIYDHEKNIIFPNPRVEHEL